MRTKEDILNQYESFRFITDELDETHYYKDNVLFAMQEYADEQSVQFADWLKENAPMGLYNNGKCIKPYTTSQLLTIFKEQNNNG